jgi:hypothetical protein
VAALLAPPELPAPVITLSLGAMRRRIEAAMVSDDIIVLLHIDKLAKREHDARRSGGVPGLWPR